ncbi:hypothetical protein [Sphingomonas sp. BK580]|uniref:hypothetical protein n=1 Tax=Sphingomonas sp. BK580 TaxID=2586972 RepID=UPI00160FD638|nr:hypothetical protein [Sphingomonas sp. BK580]MBB3695232.1 hypothetical protein [Sphingomonas sp. BK580]
MDPLIPGLAEHFIEWVDDRFGRVAAWLAGMLALLALTAGTVALGVAAVSWFGF